MNDASGSDTAFIVGLGGDSGGDWQVPGYPRSLHLYQNSILGSDDVPVHRFYLGRLLVRGTG